MNIEKANKIHNNKYDYSLVEYKNAHTKVKIICPKHGVFEQRPNNHIDMKQGCPLCSGNVKLINFSEKSNKIHNNKYDYSLVNYINNNTMVKIICPLHGVFEQRPKEHLKGSGCPICYGNKRLSTKEFIVKSNEIHNNKYDYSLTEYKNDKTKVKIICPKHDVFEQKPNDHLKGCGCAKCNGGIKMLQEIFIKKSQQSHNNKYDYSLVNYINSKTKVKIICPVHGIFEQNPNDHLKGCGCPICKESKGERTISILLNNKNIHFIRQKRFNNCKDKKQLPFDFYLPDFNMCIEYDGRQHYQVVDDFGGEKEFKKIQKRDKIKNNYCLKSNIYLLRISYKQDIKKELQKLYENIEKLEII